MAAVEMRTDLTALLEAISEQDDQQLVRVARALVQDTTQPAVLLGRLGLIAARADRNGNVVAPLGAAAMLARALAFVPEPVDPQVDKHAHILPLFIQALRLVAPAVREGLQITPQIPEPFFPGLLVNSTTETVNGKLNKAVEDNDALMVERLLLGFYGTGADYRTLQSRAYESISTQFDNAGDALNFAAGGFQVLDTVEWGKHMPEIIHWMAPLISHNPQAKQPDWLPEVREYVASIQSKFDAIRKRISFPKDEAALPLRQLVLSDASTKDVLAGVWKAIQDDGASASAVASVLTISAADILAQVDDSDRETFYQVAQGLLYAASVRDALRRVQEVSIYPLIFTAAATVNALQKAVKSYLTPQKPEQVAGTKRVAGGGFIGAAQLENLTEQIKANDYADAWHTIVRYHGMKHDVRALFGILGAAAAYTDLNGEVARTFMLVQAVHESVMGWPKAFEQVSLDPFFHVALRAVIAAPRDAFMQQF